MIDFSTLAERGWATSDFVGTSERELIERILAIANRLGSPIPARIGTELCDRLRPTETNRAKRRSLSRAFSTGEFPCHNDTAHWLTPCRYVILGCSSPGAGCRTTILLDTLRLPLRQVEKALLYTTPMRITNGRNSFFGLIFSDGRSFVRYDPGCMTPVDLCGRRALDILSHQSWPNHVEEICWERGKTVIIDNWRVLHGRGASNIPDHDRTLLRVIVR